MPCVFVLELNMKIFMELLFDAEKIIHSNDLFVSIMLCRICKEMKNIKKKGNKFTIKFYFLIFLVFVFPVEIFFSPWICNIVIETRINLVYNKDLLHAVRKC